MPPQLTRLDDATVAEIAAGEVISRPARVVSELIDNALDAGASRIAIAVDGDGTERIRLKDDGHGLSRSDAELAVQRHTTSKLPADAGASLTAVSTLGFRGEALAAICDCATVEISTNDGDAVGTKLRVENGEPTVADAARGQGTRHRHRPFRRPPSPPRVAFGAGRRVQPDQRPRRGLRARPPRGAVLAQPRRNDDVHNDRQ